MITIDATHAGFAYLDAREIRPLHDRDRDLINWKFVCKFLIEYIQSLALAADVDAQNFLDLHRKFIKNNDLVTRTITMDGVDKSLLSTKVWCVDPDEVNFIMSRAFELEFNFSLTTLADYIANGVQESFVS